MLTKRGQHRRGKPVIHIHNANNLQSSLFCDTSDDEWNPEERSCTSIGFLVAANKFQSLFPYTENQTYEEVKKVHRLYQLMGSNL